MRQSFREASTTTTTTRKSLLCHLSLSLFLLRSLACGSLRCELSLAGSLGTDLPVPLVRKAEVGNRAPRRHREAGPTTAASPKERACLRRFLSFFLFLLYFLFRRARQKSRRRRRRTLFESIVPSLSLFENAMLASLLSASLHRSRAAASLTASCSGRLLTSIGGRNSVASPCLFPVFSTGSDQEKKTQPLQNLSSSKRSKQPPRPPPPSPPPPSLSPPPPPAPPPSSASARATPSASWRTGR